MNKPQFVIIAVLLLIMLTSCATTKSGPDNSVTSKPLPRQDEFKLNKELSSQLKTYLEDNRFPRELSRRGIKHLHIQYHPQTDKSDIEFFNTDWQLILKRTIQRQVFTELSLVCIIVSPFSVGAEVTRNSNQQIDVATVESEFHELLKNYNKFKKPAATDAAQEEQ